jgi:exodeoxyribonuclease VII small subunit
VSGKKEMSFEEGLQRLEEIVERLSSEEISLDESFKIYEEGSKLIKYCSGKITEYEGKIKTLTEEFESSFDGEDQ